MGYGQVGRTILGSELRRCVLATVAIVPVTSHIIHLKTKLFA